MKIQTSTQSLQYASQLVRYKWNLLVILICTTSQRTTGALLRASARNIRERTAVVRGPHCGMPAVAQPGGHTCDILRSIADTHQLRGYIGTHRQAIMNDY